MEGDPFQSIDQDIDPIRQSHQHEIGRRTHLDLITLMHSQPTDGSNTDQSNTLQAQRNRNPNREIATARSEIREKPEGMRSSAPTRSRRGRRWPRRRGGGRRCRTSGDRPRTFATTFSLSLWFGLRFLSGSKEGALYRERGHILCSARALQLSCTGTEDRPSGGAGAV